MTTFAEALPERRRLFFVMPGDWSWWIWLSLVACMIVGLSGYPTAFVIAIFVSFAQTLLFLARDKHLVSFPVQVRVAYTLLLMVSFVPGVRWLYWLPLLGTIALLVFGYCPMARFLSMMPWNREEPMSWDLFARTWLSRPQVPETTEVGAKPGCAGNMCSIEAQVARRAEPVGREP